MCRGIQIPLSRCQVIVVVPEIDVKSTIDSYENR